MSAASSRSGWSPSRSTSRAATACAWRTPGIAELQRYVDTLIVIPNQNLFRVANERTTFAEAFSMADQVLHSGVRSITDLMVLPGLINLDFADVRTVMTEMGKAMMGTGEASGEARAMMAAQNAIQNPLLDEVSLKGAKAVLVNVTGGPDMTLLEVDEACNAISAEVDPDANTIFGAAFDDRLEGKIRVSVVATGMDGMAMSAIEPKPIRITAPAPKAMETAPREAIVDVEVEEVGDVVEAQPELLPLAAVEAPPAPVVEAPLIKLIDPSVEADDYDLNLPSYSDRTPAAASPQHAMPFASEPAEDASAADSPLFIPERRQPQKGGWLNLFGGRQRTEVVDETPIPQFRNKNAAVIGSRPSASAQPVEEIEEGQDDLEIPSFLRRLAN